MTTAFDEPASIPEQIKKLSEMINRLRLLGLDTHSYYNVESDTVYDLDAQLEQLKTPGVKTTISQIFPAIDFPSPRQRGDSVIAVGLVATPDPAGAERVRVAIEELTRLIEKMEAKGLDPRKVYDIKNDKVIDIRATLDSYLNGPKLAL